MFKEFKKSIQSVLYERVTSPFSGAFFFSWCVWNWKLVYYLFFSNENVINRIDYAQINFINIENNLIYPFLSSIFLVVGFPFVTTGTYWIWLKFKKWQTDIRNLIEMNQVISLEKSIELRSEMVDQSTKFNSILKQKEEDHLIDKDKMNKLFESQKAKDDEIVNLNSQINTIADTLNSESDRLLKAKEEDYENQIKELNKSLEIREIEIKNFQNRIQDLVNKISEFDQNTSNNNDYPDYKEYKQFKRSKFYNDFNQMIDAVTNSIKATNYLNTISIAFFESNEIVESIGSGVYKFTSKGRNFLKYYLNE